MNHKKKLPLPLLVLIIGVGIGLLFAAFGLYRQLDAQQVNEERAEQAQTQANENAKKLEKRYAEIAEELVSLEDQLAAKSQECNSIQTANPTDWFANVSTCRSEESKIQSAISDLETEQWQIENYPNIVYYDEVEPMSYLVFYIIGGSIAGVAALGAFIIYLVKGKKTY